MTLDLMGGLLLTAALLVNAHAFLDALDIRRSTALWLAACFGLWVGLQISLYQVGAFQTGFAGLFPLIGLMVAAPVAATGIAAWRVPEVRRVLLAMPMETLIGLNGLRIFGFFFILLAADGRLAGPFPASRRLGRLAGRCAGAAAGASCSAGDGKSPRRWPAGTRLARSTCWPP